MITGKHGTGMCSTHSFTLALLYDLKQKILLKEKTYHKYDDENKTDPYYY